MKNDRDVRMTHTTLRLLRVFYDDPQDEKCGADIWNVTKIGAGSLYPILYRLEDAGWLNARWETIDPHEEGRPRRRYYKITNAGFAKAQTALQERDMLGGVLAWNT